MEITKKNLWNEIIYSFSNRDIYFTYEYSYIFSKNGDGIPILFYFESEIGKVVYPFMLRDIENDKNFKGKIKKNTYFDIISCYGYGGPLYEVYDGYDINLLKESFFIEFSNYCKNNNIISQFDRFHPLLNNQVFFEGYSDLINIRKTVSIDLKNEEFIWTNIDSKCRNMIRKAIKNSVKIIINDNLSTISNFKKIYEATMNNNDAEDYYYFNSDFFDVTMNELNENIVIVNAYLEDKIISSALIMKYNKNLHYHFSGTLPEFRNLQSNNLLLYEVAKWGHNYGYDIFHLGGGYESADDSLYRFKKSFSKLEDNNYFIGKKIWNNELYKKFSLLSKNDSNIDFFPEYRR